MDSYGQRFRLAREYGKLSQEKLGVKIGLTQPSVHSIETGDATGSKYTLAVARETGVRHEWLEKADGPMVESGTPRKVLVKPVPTPPAATAGQRALDGPLEVLGMAEGGPDGWSLWNGEVIEYMPRPANLVGVPDAYAVYITGSSMEPRYHPGERAHIHPHKPITIGCYVLVQKRPNGPGEAPLAVIKRLAKKTSTKYVLEQNSPAKTFEIRIDDVVSIHRVVGSSEA